MSESGHEHHFRDVRDESGLPPTPERLRQRSEPKLRAITDQVTASNKGGFDRYCALAAFIGRTKTKRDDG
jgi:hypothetical protein